MRALLFLALLSTALTSAQSAQEDVPTFRMDVTVVRLDVKVSDSQGRPIAELSKDDFVIVDEGQKQQIVDFEKESDALRVLLLLDVSNSMWPSLRDLSRVTQEGLSRIKGGGEAALMLFALRNEIAQPFTPDFQKIEEKLAGAIFKQTLGSGTVLNDAIVSAAQYLKAQPEKARRAILVVTDGDVHRLKTNDADATRALDEARALLSAIVVRPDQPERSQTPRYTDPALTVPTVATFARHTGGDVVATAHAGTAFENLVRGLQARYTLQYSPPGAEPGSYRQVRVELSESARIRYPDARIDARTGYYVSK